MWHVPLTTSLNTKTRFPDVVAEWIAGIDAHHSPTPTPPLHRRLVKYCLRRVTSSVIVFSERDYLCQTDAGVPLFIRSSKSSAGNWKSRAVSFLRSNASHRPSIFREIFWGWNTCLRDRQFKKVSTFDMYIFLLHCFGCRYISFEYFRGHKFSVPNYA